MSQVFDFLERSLVSSITPEQQAQRRSDILRSKSVVKRAGGLALHRMATKHPKIVSKVLGRDPDTRGLEYVGQGYNSIVYKGLEEVIKVNFRSVGMSEAERVRLATQQAEEYQRLRCYIGGLVLAQENFVGSHPVKKGKRAVLICQPYCPHNRLEIFSRRMGEVVPEDLEHDTNEHPNLSRELRQLIEGANEMYDDTGLLPDTLGRGNLVAKDHRLILIDGQPIDSDKPQLQGMILQHLDDIALGLDRAGL